MKGNRAGCPFVGINCANLQDTLFETELFGCERGAYTGAEFRKGKFELAHGGTLFLDEVGELSLQAQAKLLRVVETFEIDRVGGQRPVSVDVRLIVATNRDLEEMARTQKFRDDLYDRLNMDTIRPPPLHERLDDIPILAEYFIGVYVTEARRLVTGVAQQVLDVFQQYLWPGNIRELENVIRRAVFKGRSDVIRLEDLQFDFAKRMMTAPARLGNYHELTQEYSRQLLQQALNQASGNRSKAAALLDLSRSQMYKLIKLHKLDGNRGSSRKNPDGLDDLRENATIS